MMVVVVRSFAGDDFSTPASRYRAAAYIAIDATVLVNGTSIFEFIFFLVLSMDLGGA